MSIDTTLPTLADVKTRIHTLPGRPPIMLAADVAELFKTSPSNFVRQVRKHQNLFTPEMMIELSPDEYRQQLCFQSTTVERKRTDLAQLGFTEQGVMMAATLMRSKRAKQMVQVIVRAFIQQREATIHALNRELAIDRQEYIGKRFIRQRIVAAAENGDHYVQLYGRWPYSHRALTGEIEAMRVRGHIAKDALIPPRYILRELRDHQDFIQIHVEDTRQERLGQEG